MALGIAKILLSGTGLPTGNNSAYFQLANIVVNTAGANLNIAIPAGVYIANTPANCTVQANLGSNVTYLAANACGTIVSDGINVFANTTTNGTLILATVNGGEAVTGTFNK